MNNNKEGNKKMEYTPKTNPGAQIKEMRIQWLVEELDSATTPEEYTEMTMEILRVGQLSDREIVSEWVDANFTEGLVS